MLQQSGRIEPGPSGLGRRRNGAANKVRGSEHGGLPGGPWFDSQCRWVLFSPPFLCPELCHGTKMVKIG